MASKLPRLDKITVSTGLSLIVKWKGSAAMDTVDLSGWIYTGGELLAALKSRDVFLKAEAINWGAAVSWDAGEGDLAIDAKHLQMIAAEQKPFSNEDVRSWQAANNVSNAEAASFVGVSPSTWATYKVDASIPRTVVITLRAAQRDPLILQAYMNPSQSAGRPRKDQGAVS